MTDTLALPYNKALAQLLADPRKSALIRALRKGELSFKVAKQHSGYEHNQSLSRALREFEDLGLVDHTFRHGSAEVYSFYDLTPFGKEVLVLLDSVERARHRRKSETVLVAP